MKLKQRLFILTVFSTAFFLPAGGFSLLFPVFLSNAACAAEVTLAWDANTESNLVGYKLYYESEIDIELYGGTDANEGDSPITISLLSLRDPDSPMYTISGLEEGTFYYFALTAFDIDGMESDFSEEVGAVVGGGESASGGGCFLTCTMGCSNTTGKGLSLKFLSVLLGVIFLIRPKE